MKYLEGQKVPDSGWLHYLPFGFILCANLFWPLSWIYNNENNVNCAESTIVRGLITGLFNYIICLWRGHSTSIKSPSNFRIYVLRNTLIIFHTAIISGSQFVLPLPIVHTINCSGILVVFVLDYFINGTKINRIQALGIGIGLIGVLANSNGNLLTSLIDSTFQFNSQFKNYITEDPYQKSLFSLFMFLIVVGWAYSVILVKDLKGQNSFQLNYHMSIAFVLAGGIAYPFFTPNISLKQYGLSFLLFGILITIAQFFFAGGLTMSKESGNLIMMNSIGIVESYLLSIFRYNQSFTLISIIGMVLVFVGIFLAITAKSKSSA